MFDKIEKQKELIRQAENLAYELIRYQMNNDDHHDDDRLSDLIDRAWQRYDRRKARLYDLIEEIYNEIQKDKTFHCQICRNAPAEGVLLAFYHVHQPYQMLNVCASCGDAYDGRENYEGRPPDMYVHGGLTGYLIDARCINYKYLNNIMVRNRKKS